MPTLNHARPMPTLPPPHRSSGAPPVHFFRNFNRVVGSAYVAVMLVLAGFFAWQLQQRMEDEVRSLSGQVARHAQLIEFSLRASADAVEAMRAGVQMHYEWQAQGRSSSASPLRPWLRPQPGGFSLDALPNRDWGANLVGAGPLADVPVRDLDAALSLMPIFQTQIFTLPGVARSQLVSVAPFVMSSPWMASAELPPVAPAHVAPLGRLGTPEVNPMRQRFWAPAYDAGKQLGLLVPTGAPVYDAAQHRGVVVVETSVDYLNRLNSDFGYPLGTPMLVDAQGAVLAHPDLYADPLQVQHPPDLVEALPPALQSALLDAPAAGAPQAAALLAGLAGLEPDRPQHLGGLIVIRHRFVSAPWQLVYVVPQSALLWRLLADRGPATLAVLVGLMLLIFITYRVTSNDFILPANQLVRHLAAASRFQPSPMPEVPEAWQPWFETISQAFRESLQLIGLRQELDLAAKMQQSILPRHWPGGPDWALWGTMRPAKEVGGDFYDHFPLPGGRLGLVCADVSGKGVGAALFGMVSKTLLRATAQHDGVSLADTFAKVNDGLCDGNEACMFVTAWYGIYEPASGRLSYVNAGHPPPLWLHANGEREFLPLVGDMALGVMEDMRYRVGEVTLAPGEQLLIYTDGITEAMNPAAQEFGAQRLLHATPSPQPTPAGSTTATQALAAQAQASTQAVLSAVDAFAGEAPQADDITCVLLCRTPGAQT